MRALATLALLALSLVPSLAEAGPLTAGVSLGLSQDEAAADYGEDARRTVGLFGRLQVSRRVAGQLELARFDDQGSGTTTRTGTALIVVDLTDGGRWVPTIMGGGGLDHAANDFSSTRGHHLEGGFGIEYRSPGGFTLGADLRLGGRSVEQQDVLLDVGGDVPYILPPQGSLRAGEYRSARAWLGVRF